MPGRCLGDAVEIPGEIQRRYRGGTRELSVSAPTSMACSFGPSSELGFSEAEATVER
jgi:hypothetical protein